MIMMMSNDRSLFVRAAAAVGDLGNPFYDEERQREVWNEAASGCCSAASRPPV